MNFTRPLCPEAQVGGAFGSGPLRMATAAAAVSGDRSGPPHQDQRRRSTESRLVAGYRGYIPVLRGICRCTSAARRCIEVIKVGVLTSIGDSRGSGGVEDLRRWVS